MFLCAITVAAFWPIFQNDFVKYDDPDYVTQNFHVLRGLSWTNIEWAFAGGHAGNWHPLTWLSHMLDVELFGVKARGHHLMNLLFHLGNTVLVFCLLMQMTGAFWRSALVAGFFGVHPLHVESVAWVAERKDVLSSFFGLLSLLAYSWFVGASPWRKECGKQDREAPRSLKDKTPVRRSVVVRKKWSWYAISLLFFVCGLMSKPMLVTLPCIMLLLDFWPFRRVMLVSGRVSWPGAARLIYEKLPFFALAILSSIVTFQIQQTAGAVGSLEALPMEFRLSNALISYARYIGKMVWPTRLAVFYPAPHEWSGWAIAGAGLLVAGITIWVLWRAQRAPYALVGWLWYLGTLLPVIGIIQVGQQAMADRYSYLPIIGLLIGLVWSIAELQSRVLASRAWLLGLGWVAIAGCAVLTWKQVHYWKDNFTLFEHAIAVTSENAVAHNNLGVSLLEAGDYAKAATHFAEAVRLKHNYPDALVNLGNCEHHENHDEEAKAAFGAALQIQSNAAAHYNLANLLSEQGQLVVAQSHYESAVQLKPEFIEAWYNLARLNLKLGRAEEAAANYATVIKLKPDYVGARLGLGALLASERKLDEAFVQFNAAVQSAPDNPDGHFNLGLLWMYQGKATEAAAQFQQAVRLRSDAETQYNLGLALQLDGRSEAAAAHYHEAVRLKPEEPLYLNDLAWLLATDSKSELRNGSEAVALAEKACRLSDSKQPRYWGTLDAAYAEAGRFEKAIETAIKARDLALAAGQPEIAQKAEERLALYRLGKPYRLSPAASGEK